MNPRITDIRYNETKTNDTVWIFYISDVENTVCLSQLVDQQHNPVAGIQSTDKRQLAICGYSVIKFNGSWTGIGLIWMYGPTNHTPCLYWQPTQHLNAFLLSSWSCVRACVVIGIPFVCICQEKRHGIQPLSFEQDTSEYVLVFRISVTHLHSNLIGWPYARTTELTGSLTS